MPAATESRQIQYDRCRGLHHNWYDIDADRAPSFGYYMWEACDCGTIKKDIVDRFGNVLSRSYDYPDDYRDSEGHTKADFRARVVARKYNGAATPADETIAPIRRNEVSEVAYREYLRRARLAARDRSDVAS